jgi:hypothetical protein
VAEIHHGNAQNPHEFIDNFGSPACRSGGGETGPQEALEIPCLTSAPKALDFELEGHFPEPGKKEVTFRRPY